MIVLSLLACPAPDGESSPPVDTGICADAPTVDYETFGSAFISHTCQPCHASTVTGDDRNDAPTSVTFDTVALVWARAADILAVATGPAPIMPPGGGVTDDDLKRLEIWLNCAEPGT